MERVYSCEPFSIHTVYIATNKFIHNASNEITRDAQREVASFPGSLHTFYKQ